MSSGSVKVYGPEAPSHPGPGTRFYGQRYKSGQGKPVLEMSPSEADVEAVRRAKCYVQEHPGTDFKSAYREILADDSVLRERARPAPEQREQDESQPAKAYRHTVGRAAHFVRTGQARSLREAHRLACAESPALAERAGADPALRGDPAAQVKLHAGPGTQVPTHGEARTLPRDVLVRQIAAAALTQGLWRPGPDARALADTWVGWNFPAPPAGSGTAVLDSYNLLRERTVNEIVEAARRLLADPAERAKLHPAQ